MLSGVPLAFPLGFDAGAIDQKVQWAAITTVGKAYVQRLLPTAQGAEIRHNPVQPDQPQQAFHEARGLPQRLTKQYLHRQASLDRSIAELLLPTALAAGARHPDHVRIKPDR